MWVGDEGTDNNQEIVKALSCYPAHFYMVGSICTVCVHREFNHWCVGLSLIAGIPNPTALSWTEYTNMHREIQQHSACCASVGEFHDFSS